MARNVSSFNTGGVVGPQGPAGAQSAQGSQGVVGSQGTTGTTGTTGSQGNQGTQGTAGSSSTNGPVIIWSDNGGVLGGVRYMQFGTGTASTTEIQLRVSRAVLVRNLSILAQTAPGVGRSAIFTVRKNGVDTALFASLVDSNTVAFETTTIVSFAQGDALSLRIVSTTGSSLANVVVSVEA